MVMSNPEQEVSRQGKLAAIIKWFYDKPLEFVKMIIKASPTPQQEAVLARLQSNIQQKRSVFVRSGHGIGKTALQCWIILWFLSTRKNAKVPCTAPTQHQLYDVQWAELAKWHAQMREPFKGTLEWTATHLRHKTNPDVSFATAQTASKPENLQGFHSENLLFIVDEASGVPEEIMQVIEGALTNEGAIVLMCGNPTRLTGSFYRAFHEGRERYDLYHFSSEESLLVNPQYCQQMAEKYSKDSDVYRVRVLGDFPNAESDSFISLAKAEEATAKIPFDDASPAHVGVDVARFGDDSTSIYVRVGNSIVEHETHHQEDTMLTCGRIMQALQRRKGRNVFLAIDDTGVGGGVTDRLQELKSQGEVSEQVSIIPVNNGESSSDEQFVNLGTQLWFRMREMLGALRTGAANTEALVAQLSTRKYSITSKGKLCLESKAEMKKRGVPSPDEADALSLTFAEETVGDASNLGFYLA